jgi:hypothetical protein
MLLRGLDFASSSHSGLTCIEEHLCGQQAGRIVALGGGQERQGQAACVAFLHIFKSSPFVRLLLLIKLGSRGLVLSATGLFHANRWVDVMG